MQTVHYRVLCFGDSLTRGYYKHGMHESPYSNTLEVLFSREHVSVTIMRKGVDGRYVDPEMVRELPKFLDKLQALQIPNEREQCLDVCVLLGGTNDLDGSKGNGAHIFTKLRAMYEMCLCRSIHVIAVTVPDMSAETSARGVLRERMHLNACIKQYVAEDTSGFLSVADLASHIPIHPDSAYASPSSPSLSSSSSPLFAPSQWTDNKIYYDDGCHFTPAGYEKFGYLIFSTISRLRPLANSNGRIDICSRICGRRKGSEEMNADGDNGCTIRTSSSSSRSGEDESKMSESPLTSEEQVSMLLEQTRKNVADGNLNAAIQLLMVAAHVSAGEAGVAHLQRQMMSEKEQHERKQKAQRQAMRDETDEEEEEGDSEEEEDSDENLDEVRQQALSELVNDSSLLGDKKGGEEVLAKAFVTGSCVICPKCKGLVGRDRWDAHASMWCPALPQSADEDSD